MTVQTSKGWPTSRGPIASLRNAGRIKVGVRSPSWATKAITHVYDTNGTKEVCEAEPKFLTPAAIQDLAWLSTEGFDVFLRHQDNAILVRIANQPPAAYREPEGINQ